MTVIMGSLTSCIHGALMLSHHSLFHHYPNGLAYFFYAEKRIRVNSTITKDVTRYVLSILIVE